MNHDASWCWPARNSIAEKSSEASTGFLGDQILGLTACRFPPKKMIRPNKMDRSSEWQESEENYLNSTYTKYTTKKTTIESTKHKSTILKTWSKKGTTRFVGLLPSTDLFFCHRHQRRKASTWMPMITAFRANKDPMTLVFCWQTDGKFRMVSCLESFVCSCFLVNLC